MSPMILTAYPGYPNKLKQPDSRPFDKRNYVLAEDYEISIFHNRLIIPTGFLYDGASVPRWCWSIVGLRPDGLIRAAALVHDYLYRQKGCVRVIPPIGFSKKVLITKRIADKLFHELMLKAGIRPFRANLAYYAVSLFGRYE